MRGWWKSRNRAVENPTAFTRNPMKRFQTPTSRNPVMVRRRAENRTWRVRKSILLKYGNLTVYRNTEIKTIYLHSFQIKAAEKRMAEIAVLRTHIINYAKTREVYVAYRKAGYSKKFLAEHEADILLHKAAKNAFDDMGVKKLPNVKSLQTEYAKVLEEKKKAYAEYRRSREEMRELLTAKANVDRLLNMEAEHGGEKKKDHAQR